ncbi:MAG: DNA-binding domain-containing protein [Planctomycetales bacterium]
MTSDDIPLASLQRWMQSVIMHPAETALALLAAPVQEAWPVEAGALETILGRSAALTAEERLEIYRRSYWTRLLDCLREEFSVFAAAVGPDLFDSFALAYLHDCPPASYTLGDLGKGFPEYLSRTRPVAQSALEGALDWSDFLIDLARLERTVTEVFDGPGGEGGRLLDHERLAAVPSECWPGARLECVPSLRLLTLSFPVHDYFTAVRQGSEPRMPPREAAFMVVLRREYRVFRYPLTAVQFELLSGLSQGDTVGGAIERAGGVAGGISDERFASELQRWFSMWVADGFFRDVRFDSLPSALLQAP